MLVSLLVPIYNVEKHLTKCLDTLFNQTYPNVEYIFLDDHSPDGSMSVLHTYIENHQLTHRQITFLAHTENKGIATTRNDLVKQAKGDYILFVDSDDWMELDMVEQLVLATKNGAVDMVGCDYTKNYADGRQTCHFENYASDSRDNIALLLNYTIGPVLWKLLVRKKLFLQIQFQPDIEIGEDYLASVKLYYYADSCSWVHRYLYHYAQYNENRYTGKLAKSIEDHIKAVIAVEAFLDSVGFMNPEIVREINLRKFSIKRYYLFSPLLDFQRWTVLFPESDGMWRYIPYSKKEKVMYWLAEHHFFFLLQWYRQFMQFLPIDVIIIFMNLVPLCQNEA